MKKQNSFLKILDAFFSAFPSTKPKLIAIEILCNAAHHMYTHSGEYWSVGGSNIKYIKKDICHILKISFFHTHYSPILSLYPWSQRLSQLKWYVVVFEHFNPFRQHWVIICKFHIQKIETRDHCSLINPCHCLVYYLHLWEREEKMHIIKSKQNTGFIIIPLTRLKVKLNQISDHQ